MANGIFDTFTTGTGGPILFPDQSPDLPPPGEILDEGLAELAQRAGIDITAQEAGDLRETVLAGGNVGRTATDIAANIAERKRDSIINSGLASVAPELLSPFTGVNQAVGVINTADYLTNLAADFAQGVPVAGPLTAEAADFTGDLSQLTFDVTSPLYRGVGFLQNKIIDPITGRIRNVVDPRRLLNLISPFDDDDDTRDGDLTQIVNQADDDRRDDDPPVPTTVTGVSGPAGMVVDPGAVSSSFGGRGGADRGGDVVIGGSTPGTVVIGGTTGTTPGPAGMGFTPPAPKRDRFPMGRAEGGLASIPKYLKGR
tara:strand:- start:44 stop:982 length:939 start_codon:yes stop_codon:yes gene_type:complete